MSFRIPETVCVYVRSLIGCILGLVCSTGQLHAQATDSNLLLQADEVIQLNRENFRSIKTWEGVARIESSQYKREYDLTVSTVAHARFVYDRESKQVQSYYFVADWQPSKASPHAIPLSGFESGTLWSGDRCYSLAFRSYARGQPKTVVDHPLSEVKIRPFNDPERFFPLAFFCDEDSDASVGEDLERVLTWARGTPPNGATYSFHQPMPNHFMLEWGIDTFPEIVQRYTYREDYAGNLVRSRRPSSSVSDHTAYDRTITWKQIAGCWVPSSWSQVTDLRGDGSTVNTMVVKWISQSVNSSLPPEAFTMEFMGVNAGAVLRHSESGVEDRYKGNTKAARSVQNWLSKSKEFLPVTTVSDQKAGVDAAALSRDVPVLKAPPPTDSTQHRVLWFSLSAVAVLILCFLCWLFWIR